MNKVIGFGIIIILVCTSITGCFDDGNKDNPNRITGTLELLPSEVTNITPEMVVNNLTAIGYQVRSQYKDPHPLSNEIFLIDNDISDRYAFGINLNQSDPNISGGCFGYSTNEESAVKQEIKHQIGIILQAMNLTAYWYTIEWAYR